MVHRSKVLKKLDRIIEILETTVRTPSPTVPDNYPSPIFTEESPPYPFPYGPPLSDDTGKRVCFRCGMTFGDFSSAAYSCSNAGCPMGLSGDILVST